MTGAELSTELSRPYLPTGGGSLVAAVTVDPGRRTGDVTRQVALVVDTSGSMSGEKIRQARAGAEWVLGYLDGDDVLSIVEFSDEASVPMAATRYGDIDREAATRQVGAMTAGGGTDVHAGLAAATEQLVTLPDGEDVVRRILLLSDGRDNHRGPEAFRRQAGAIDDRGIRIRAAGLGSDYHQETIRTLGTVARGQWRHIERAEGIRDFFGEAVEEASTVVGTDAELHMDVADGVEFTEVYRAMPQTQRVDVEYVDDNEAVVGLPDLLDRREQRVQMKVRAPGGDPEAGGGTTTLAECSLRAGGRTATGSIDVEYTEDGELLGVENRAVSIGFDETRIRESLGRGATREAERRVTRLREKHGAAAAESATELEKRVTRVREGGRAEQAETTLVREGGRL